MRGLKTLVSSTALFAALALAPAAHSQVSVNIGVQPVCQYGYYGYEPYSCAPMGYYGSGYFYNGIFVGMGPWSGWGYNHGWGSHRFNGDGGGRFHGGIGRAAYGGRSGGSGQVRGGGGTRMNRGASHAGGMRPGAAHGAPHASAARGGASRGGGGGSRGGGGSHK